MAFGLSTAGARLVKPTGAAKKCCCCVPTTVDVAISGAELCYLCDGGPFSGSLRKHFSLAINGSYTDIPLISTTGGTRPLSTYQKTFTPGGVIFSTGSANVPPTSWPGCGSLTVRDDTSIQFTIRIYTDNLRIKDVKILTTPNSNYNLTYGPLQSLGISIGESFPLFLAPCPYEMSYVAGGGLSRQGGTTVISGTCTVTSPDGVSCPEPCDIGYLATISGHSPCPCVASEHYSSSVVGGSYLLHYSDHALSGADKTCSYTTDLLTDNDAYTLVGFTANDCATPSGAKAYSETYCVYATIKNSNVVTEISLISARLGNAFMTTDIVSASLGQSIANTTCFGGTMRLDPVA